MLVKTFLLPFVFLTMVSCQEEKTFGLLGSLFSNSLQSYMNHGHESIYNQQPWHQMGGPPSYGMYSSWGHGRGGRYARRAKSGSSAKLSKLSALVKTMKMEDCVGKVVCDLSCQPDYFGNDGKQVMRTLVKIQTSGKMEKEDMRFYLNAGVAGRKAKTTDPGCTICFDAYPSCAASTVDLIDVVSLIRIDI